MERSWIDDLVGLGGSLIDVVGEVGVSVGSAYGNALGGGNTPNVNELTAQPEVNKQREPTKGQNSDGSPIVVGQDGKPLNHTSQWIAGIDNRLTIGGSVIVLFLLGLVLRR